MSKVFDAYKKIGICLIFVSVGFTLANLISPYGLVETYKVGRSAGIRNERHRAVSKLKEIALTNFENAARLTGASVLNEIDLKYGVESVNFRRLADAVRTNENLTSQQFYFNGVQSWYDALVIERGN